MKSRPNDAQKPQGKEIATVGQTVGNRRIAYRERSDGVDSKLISLIETHFRHTRSIGRNCRLKKQDWLQRSFARGDRSVISQSLQSIEGLLW